MTEMVRLVSIRFERRLAEVVLVIDCITPTPDQFYCDDTRQLQRVNRTVDDHLERLNTTRFTATSYVFEHPDRLFHVDDGGLGRRITVAGPADRSRTAADDAVLVDFGIIWVVFLTLDVLLVTRRIGNVHFFRILEL